jgi:hypothetical protein
MGGRLILDMKSRLRTTLLKFESVRRARKRYSCKTSKPVYWWCIQEVRSACLDEEEEIWILRHGGCPGSLFYMVLSDVDTLYITSDCRRRSER